MDIETNFIARLYKAGTQLLEKMNYAVLAIIGLFAVGFLFLPTLNVVAALLGGLIFLTIDALFILYALLIIGLGIARFGLVLCKNQNY